MNTKYFVLDANVIYNYIGRYKLGMTPKLKYNQQRLTRTLDNSVLFVSSSVLTEVLVHFRNDLDKVREIIIFMHEKIEYVLTASTNCADENTVDAIIRAKNDEERKKILNDVLLSKARIETYVAYVFAGAISAILGDLLIEDTIKRSKQEINPDEYSQRAMNEIISKREYFLDEGCKKLLSFYETNKESDGMKIIYDNFLTSNFKAYENELFVLHKKINPKSTDTFESFSLSLELSSVPDKMYSTMAKLVSDFKKVKDYKNRILEKINTLTQKWEYFDRWQKEYIASRFDCYLGHTKFRKNDVFDTLFLGAYKDESIEQINKRCKKKGMPKCTRSNFHLLTFDTDVFDYLSQIDFKGALIADRIKEERKYPGQ